MGINLVVEVLDHAPPGLAPGDRLMLVVLAEQARDATRECWPGDEVLAHRTGTAPRSVRRTIARLEQAGLVERVPVGVDTLGRPIYAHRGHATTYRIAPLKVAEPVALDDRRRVDEAPESRTEGTAKPDAKEDAPVLHFREKGGPLGPERRTAGTAKEDPPVPPPLTVPSKNPHPPRGRREERAAVIDALLERTGKTIDEDHADRVIRQLIAGRDIRHRAAYLRGAIQRDDRPERFLPTVCPPPFRREDRHA
jgi:DNA-binding transcriptional ArsR family regulator